MAKYNDILKILNLQFTENNRVQRHYFTKYMVTVFDNDRKIYDDLMFCKDRSLPARVYYATIGAVEYLMEYYEIAPKNTRINSEQFKKALTAFYGCDYKIALEPIIEYFKAARAELNDFNKKEATT